MCKLSSMCIHLNKKIGIMSRGQSHRRTNSRGRALKRCKGKGKANDVIDVDSYKNSNYIIIDPPESLEQTSPGIRISERDKTPLYLNIICIDDDDESGNCNSPQNGFERSGNQDNNFTSSNKSHPASGQSHKSVEVDGEEYQVVKGRKPSLKSSKSCQDADSMEIPSQHQHKFYFDSSSTSCENDGSDCDIIEDYMGNIREQWEKASLRKKTFKNLPKEQPGAEDQVSASGLNTISQDNVGVDKGAEQTAEAWVPSSSSNTTDRGEDVVGDASQNSNRENQSEDFKQTTEQEKCHKTPACDSRNVNELAPESMSSAELQVEKNALLLDLNCDGHPDVQNYIIGEREMLKKTDAYKRADEEEWASRQRELQIQAGEAQRLRKKKRAESVRLLEMERRQKQRVEEVREAQKKDEENLNLKERLRAEVRMELDKVEAKCRDMASLLRGLGIHVGGGVNPSSSEVRAAYKQALLSFHPDRASRSDNRHQVEAEEKFKLISRAKEKLVWT